MLAIGTNSEVESARPAGLGERVLWARARQSLLVLPAHPPAPGAQRRLDRHRQSIQPPLRNTLSSASTPPPAGQTVAPRQPRTRLLQVAARPLVLGGAGSRPSSGATRPPRPCEGPPVLTDALSPRPSQGPTSAPSPAGSGRGAMPGAAGARVFVRQWLPAQKVGMAVRAEVGAWSTQGSARERRADAERSAGPRGQVALPHGPGRRGGRCPVSPLPGVATR